MWYLQIFIFACVVPFFLRSQQERIPFKESHQALVLSLIWLSVQLSTQGRPSNNAVLAGWLFIYAFGTLVMLYGRLKDDDDDGHEYDEEDEQDEEEEEDEKKG